MKIEINKKYKRLVKYTTEATSETIPKKENKKKQRWMNEEIQQMEKETDNEKDKAFRAACGGERKIDESTL